MLILGPFFFLLAIFLQKSSLCSLLALQYFTEPVSWANPRRLATCLEKLKFEVVILQADTDKDGRLSLTEMVENPYVFYSAVYDEDEDEDYDYHDEFR